MKGKGAIPTCRPPPTDLSLLLIPPRRVTCHSSLPFRPAALDCSYPPPTFYLFTPPLFASIISSRFSRLVRKPIV
jgi:hypothetical protein